MADRKPHLYDCSGTLVVALCAADTKELTSFDGRARLCKPDEQFRLGFADGGPTRCFTADQICTSHRVGTVIYEGP